MQAGFNLANMLLVVVQFTSIVAVFAEVAFGLEILLNKKEKRSTPWHNRLIKEKTRSRYAAPAQQPLYFPFFRP